MSATTTNTSVNEDAEAARLAGWNVDEGVAPFRHGLPPAADPTLGTNGIDPHERQRQWAAYRAKAVR